MKLSKDQADVLRKIIKWYFEDKNSQFITMGGYAGTGKTTLVGAIKKSIVELSNKKAKIAFCSYTGRAAQHLKNKLKEAEALTWRDTISTIHGLIYDPIEDSRGVIIGWAKKVEIEHELIIVDEASMIDEDIWRDLLSYKVRVIAVGDHGQLPPIKGEFNLMQSPHLVLEKIHRQEIGNPIIDISILARRDGAIPAREYSKLIRKFSTADYDFHEANQNLLENYTSDTLILCGYNSTRNKINQFVRNALGFELSEPQPQDRVICLRNNQKKGIYNGMLGTIKTIKRIDDNWFDAEIIMDESNSPYTGKIYAPQFGSPEPINFTKDRAKVGMGDLFDFGYALTVHKAQGSQAKRVVLFEERFKKMDDSQWKKWLYTGVTRAEEELYIFGP